jgi:hypothetical protein
MQGDVWNAHGLPHLLDISVALLTGYVPQAGTSLSASPACQLKSPYHTIITPPWQHTDQQID